MTFIWTCTGLPVFYAQLKTILWGVSPRFRQSIILCDECILCHWCYSCYWGFIDFVHYCLSQLYWILYFWILNDICCLFSMQHRNQQSSCWFVCTEIISTILADLYYIPYIVDYMFVYIYLSYKIMLMITGFCTDSFYVCYIMYKSV